MFGGSHRMLGSLLNNHRWPQATQTRSRLLLGHSQPRGWIKPPRCLFPREGRRPSSLCEYKWNAPDRAMVSFTCEPRPAGFLTSRTWERPFLHKHLT